MASVSSLALLVMHQWRDDGTSLRVIAACWCFLSRNTSLASSKCSVLNPPLMATIRPGLLVPLQTQTQTAEPKELPELSEAAASTEVIMTDQE